MPGVFKDYYGILGLQYGASKEEIREKYLYLARRYHPNNYPQGQLSEEEIRRISDIFSEINEAYKVLYDDVRREEYDFSYVANFMTRRQERKEQTTGQGYNVGTHTSQKTNGNRGGNSRATYTYRRTAVKEENEEPVKTPKPFTKKITDAYKEVRRDEKKHPFGRRHRILNSNFNRMHGDKVDTVPKAILFTTALGTLHVFGEAFYQLRKLTYIGKDSMPKYVIRNRRLIGLTLAGVMLCSGAGSKKPDVQSPEQFVEEPPAVVELVIPEPEVTQYTLLRNYKIVYGDTLYQIAKDSRTTVQYLQELNGIKGSTIIAGHYLKVPYVVPREEIDYYTQTVEVAGRSLTQLAIEYETTEQTIYELNKESIEYNKIGTYIILSDSLRVPKFITLKEYQAKTEYPTQK